MVESSSLLILIVHLEPIGFYLFIYLGLLPAPLPHQAGIYNSGLRWPCGRTGSLAGGRVRTLSPENSGCFVPSPCTLGGAPGLTLPLAACGDRSSSRCRDPLGTGQANGSVSGRIPLGRPLVVHAAGWACRSRSSLTTQGRPAAQGLGMQGVAFWRLDRGKEEKPGTLLSPS